MKEQNCTQKMIAAAMGKHKAPDVANCGVTATYEQISTELNLLSENARNTVPSSTPKRFFI
jgi:hypothetical protein